MATETRERDFPFTLTRSSGEGEDDGLTFEGYAAVFNSPAHIEERDGTEYDEVISPGAFKRSIDRSTPVMMFNHGKHPLIGPMPLGKITELREDARGLYVKARLTDNWLISPVRDAIANEAVTGMSIRMEVMKHDKSGYGPSQLRTLKEVKVYELGPVVSPAYDDTTAMVRSAHRHLREIEGEQRAGITVGDDWSVTQMVEQAIETQMGLNDQTQDVYTIEVIDDRITFVVTNPVDNSQSGLWQATFTYDDGVVNVSAPEAVIPVEYAPRSAEPKGETRMKTNRSDVTFCDITCAVDDAIEELLGVDDMSSDIWVCDITDTWAVFSMWGLLENKWPGYWKVEYTIDADMAVTLSEPVQVEEVYVPTGTPPKRCADFGQKTVTRNSKQGPSEELAETGPSEELATTRETLDASSLAERRRYARQIMAERRAS